MTDLAQMEREALISDAKQTAVFLDNNAEDHPDMAILWQAANVMRALIRDYNKSSQRIDNLHAALHEHGVHHDNCIYHKTDDIDSCDCGFHEAYDNA